MEISGWGRYPKVDAQVHYPLASSDLPPLVEGSGNGLIAMGMGRSYGDSALANQIINTRHLDHLLAFDETDGTLTCSAGATLADILDVFVPRGWFLPVTPGTKFVSVGGAVASDVHGKNHHLEGSFTDHVSSLKVFTASEGIVECSPTINTDLFRATCGGMGLTGIITEVTFKLKAITSNQIKSTTYKVKNLAQALELFTEHQNATYSVAWIDCLARGSQLGRSLVSIGEHAVGSDLAPSPKTKLSVPLNMPDWLLNKYSIKGFNELYYHKQLKNMASSTVHYDPFFYPLDSINHWYRLYGRKGFLQYQFVVPEDASHEGIRTVLKMISARGEGSFLAVLKAFGPGNNNFLSFPMKGLTLALDFKIEQNLFPFLAELDNVVVDMNGRHYLAKDARLSESIFKMGYKDWERFSAIRQKYNANKQFNSLQSKRLGL